MDNKTCPLLLAGLMAIPNVADKERTCPSQIKINQEERRLKIHIKNQTDKKIDLCCGLDQELTLRPEREATVEVQDGDYIYIDQAI